ncbi:MAG: hypothetical protein EOO45_29280, partial [Flavobacterium sp.]
MKNMFMIAAVVLAFAACDKNKETKVESEETIIETSGDTVAIDTDTIAAVDAVKPADAAVAVKEETAKPEIREVKAEKEIKVEYASFGDKIVAEKVLSKDQMMNRYK